MLDGWEDHAGRMVIPDYRPCGDVRRAHELAAGHLAYEIMRGRTPRQVLVSLGEVPQPESWQRAFRALLRASLEMTKAGQ